MNFFKKIKNALNPDNDSERISLDVDDDGGLLFEEDIAAFVKSELEKRQNERKPLELQWQLNANFLCGNQRCDINTYSNTIEQQEPFDERIEHGVYNQIAPLIETRVANLKKISYAMKVKPRTSELDDYDKAETATAILQYMQNKTEFDTLKNTAIYWNELCGNCFWLSWWDKNKGNIIAEDEIEVIGKDGVLSRERKAYREGDIDYGLLSPYEVYPESIYKQSIKNQRSVIVEQVKSVEDVYDLYGVKLKGETVDTFALTPIVGAGGYGIENTVMSMGVRSAENSLKVITYFERPSKKRPHGRLIITAGDKVIFYGDMPYENIPIVQMVCRENPGQFFGKSVIEDLIPRQRLYNNCLNRIHEYIRRAAIQSYWVQEGAVDIEEFEEYGAEPGAIMEYKRGYDKPMPAVNGQLPSEIMTERYNLKTDMEYVAGTSQLMVNGATPSGVTSGTAIANLQAIDDTRLSLTGDFIRSGVKNLAVIWLEIFKLYASNERVIQYVGTNNIGRAITWNSSDINSYDVMFTTENELLKSEEVQKENFMNAYSMGLFTDANGVIPQRVKHKALEYIKNGDYTDMMSIDELQLQAAQRENSYFECGIIPDISEFDDDEVHLEEHMRYRLQMKYLSLKRRNPELAAMFDEHIRQHRENAQQNGNAQFMQAMTE